MRIIAKKKRNNEYYYLQHSFRKNNKVITREKYLGKTIPNNIEETKKLFLEKCDKENLFKLLEKIKLGFRKEWVKYPESIKEKIKEQIAVAFTYNTNAIEGSTITLEETREIIEKNIAPNKPIRDIEETKAHSKLFLEILNSKEDVSPFLLLEWHRYLFSQSKPDIAGRFREYLVRVADYLAPDWQDVPELLKDFTIFYNKNNKIMNPVELAFRMHYKFEKIHPFGDGNGRIGRLLMNYILWKNKFPMIIIEYKKRKSYYKALKNDESSFFHYLTRRYIKIHKKYLK